MKYQLITAAFLITLTATSPAGLPPAESPGNQPNPAGAIATEPESEPRFARSTRARIWRTGQADCRGMTGGSPVRAAVWSPQTDRQWRKTRNGWQQIDLSGRPATQYLNLPRPLAQIHPFRMTLLLLLTVAAAVAWSADEWDWHRLLRIRRDH